MCVIDIGRVDISCWSPACGACASHCIVREGGLQEGLELNEASDESSRGNYVPFTRCPDIVARLICLVSPPSTIAV